MIGFCQARNLPAKYLRHKGTPFESYIDILAELEQTSNADAKLISYGDAYRCLQEDHRFCLPPQRGDSNLLPAGRLNRRIDPPKVHIRCHDEGQPRIGKLVLTDELMSFTNQTARFHNAQRLVRTTASLFL